jgi:hypothetical protein
MTKNRLTRSDAIRDGAFPLATILTLVQVMSSFKNVLTKPAIVFSHHACLTNITQKSYK